ncbi:MAG: peptide chain release factor N(5)-glutamine methyltransferase [Deltaproteobacteria bacterium]|nr:peptide chain release factor N(5)-glutamine methyltransferase [Deltaproteobacteria bacterium]
MTSVGETIQQATAKLSAAGILTARLDAEVLLAFLWKCSRTQIIAGHEKLLSPADQQAFIALISRRIEGEPVAYITAQKEFWGIPLKVSRSVLIPRPDTEILVETVSKIATNIVGADTKTTAERTTASGGVNGATSHRLVAARGGITILELGTGSGAVACALASEGYRVTATDISVDALTLAQENARRLKQDITFVLSDLFANIASRFHIIVANLPYITDNEYEDLPISVRYYEPSLALRGGKDGLEVIRRVVAEAQNFLLPEGWLVLEIGSRQNEEIGKMFITNGYQLTEIIGDLAGLPRVALGRAPL